MNVAIYVAIEEKQHQHLESLVWILNNTFAHIFYGISFTTYAHMNLVLFYPYFVWLWMAISEHHPFVMIWIAAVHRHNLNWMAEELLNRQSTNVSFNILPKLLPFIHTNKFWYFSNRFHTYTIVSSSVPHSIRKSRTICITCIRHTYFNFIMSSLNAKNWTCR